MTETETSTADAVSLFNSSLNKALARQKAEMLEELRKGTNNSSTSVIKTARSISNVNTSACQHTKFDFKQEGTKIQFNFNSEPMTALLRIEDLLKSENIGNV